MAMGVVSHLSSAVMPNPLIEPAIQQYSTGKPKAPIHGPSIAAAQTVQIKPTGILTSRQTVARIAKRLIQATVNATNVTSTAIPSDQKAKALILEAVAQTEFSRKAARPHELIKLKLLNHLRDNGPGKRCKKSCHA